MQRDHGARAAGRPTGHYGKVPAPVAGSCPWPLERHGPPSLRTGRHAGMASTHSDNDSKGVEAYDVPGAMGVHALAGLCSQASHER